MRLCLSILIFGLAATALSQQPDSLPPGPDFSYGIIDTIIVIGNNKTKEAVVLREMTLKPGSEATLHDIEFDRNRVYSLGLFTRVDIFFQLLDGQNYLIVDVSERWYIIPVPLFGFRDGDPKKPYFGGGLLHNNFRGLNQKIFGSIVFGYNPSLSLFFSDPQIDHEHDLYFSGNLSFSRIRNKSEVESALTGDFDERHYDINTTLGKRFSIYESAGINVGFRVVD
ncbi:MAG: hypothetical protein HY708_05700, partial [Ignavibacteriae bacterium]|nr:hypothetical protein [Ignavibacteriota bacterium]